MQNLVAQNPEHRHTMPIETTFTPQELLTSAKSVKSLRTLLTLVLALVEQLLHDLWRLAVNLATGAHGSAQNLLDGTGQCLGQRLVGLAHGLCYRDDLVEGNGLSVLDVLLLLPVSWGLLEGLDDEG